MKNIALAIFASIIINATAATALAGPLSWKKGNDWVGVNGSMWAGASAAGVQAGAEVNASLLKKRFNLIRVAAAAGSGAFGMTAVRVEALNRVLLSVSNPRSLEVSLNLPHLEIETPGLPVPILGVPIQASLAFGEDFGGRLSISKTASGAYTLRGFFGAGCRVTARLFLGFRGLRVGLAGQVGLLECGLEADLTSRGVSRAEAVASAGGGSIYAFIESGWWAASYVLFQMDGWSLGRRSLI